MKGKKKIDYLVELSRTSGKLDPRKITVIAKMFERNKKELKSYYKALFEAREEEKVTVVSAIDIPKQISSIFKKMFENKEINFLKDKKILAGLVVRFSDFIFDASFKRYLDSTKKYYEIY